MLKKFGPNDIWLIGQGPSYTALCWSRSWPRISSLCEMQRQATVTKPLGSRACAKTDWHNLRPWCTEPAELAQPRAKDRLCLSGQPVLLPYHLLITERDPQNSQFCCTPSCSDFTHTQWHTHTHQHTQTYCVADIILRWDLIPSWLVSKTLSWKAHFWCSGGLDAFVLKGFFSL